ncbi:MAG TPA: sigma-54-dependent Fis family transcriptional regulator [Aeromonadales bacterium]|nr:sigma-54-dependent Fis family transcriptional regulator [Aeromonadales bacterium]
MSQSTVLLVEDDECLREALSTTLEIAGYKTIEAGNGKEALVSMQRQNPDIVVSDVQMDGMNGNEFLQALRNHSKELPFLMMTAYGSVDGAVQAMRAGATDYLQKPFAPEVLLNLVNRYIQPHQTDILAPVIEDPKSKNLFKIALKVAESQATVLLTGPSGAGKEVMARYIHNHSSRKKEPFVAINCAAIPENMLEATLFGYEKGAFTGAHQACPGKFEQAQNGTLLLDEISEMDAGLQAKLLRVLQEREVERLGSRKSISLDVRIIATSNKDLRKEVNELKFREDLYYRLNVFPIRCLALNQRPLDIIPIAEAMVESLSKQQGQPVPRLSNEAQLRLRRHNWPGNVRELENVVQRAMILHTDDYIQLADIQIEDGHQSVSDYQDTQDATPVNDNNMADNVNLGNNIRNHEYQIILEALQQFRGKRSEVSHVLGISPRTLRYKLAKMREAGIEIP